MSVKEAKSILQQALKLPKGQRLRIAEKLLDSAFDQDVLAAGIEKADAAWQAYQRGDMPSSPVEDVIERLKKRRSRKK
jgi:hypothetical protein